MIRRPPRSTLSSSSAASDVYKRQIHDGPEANGQYTDKTWDGRNEHGQLVPPGLYVVHIRVKGDAKVEEKAHIVGVAY